MSCAHACQHPAYIGPGEAEIEQIVSADGRSTRAILGGGRAGLDFDGLEGERAVFRLWCADGEVELRMEPGELTDEICGVRIRLLGVVDGRRPDDPPRAAIEVTWDPADSWDPEGAKGAKSTS